MMTDSLFPCAHCKKEDAEVIEDPVDPTDYYWVNCMTCNIRTAFCRTRDEAIAAWNKRAGGWQLIETAPKNGRRILLWCRDWHAPSTGQFYWQSFKLHDDLPEWKDAPTHWMPLPLPPTEKEDL